jgi:hypothetical protein
MDVIPPTTDVMESQEVVKNKHAKIDIWSKMDGSKPINHKIEGDYPVEYPTRKDKFEAERFISRATSAGGAPVKGGGASRSRSAGMRSTLEREDRRKNNRLREAVLPRSANLQWTAAWKFGNPDSHKSSKRKGRWSSCWDRRKISAR